MAKNCPPCYVETTKKRKSLRQKNQIRISKGLRGHGYRALRNLGWIRAGDTQVGCMMTPKIWRNMDRNACNRSKLVMFQTPEEKVLRGEEYDFNGFPTLLSNIIELFYCDEWNVKRVGHCACHSFIISIYLLGFLVAAFDKPAKSPKPSFRKLFPETLGIRISIRINNGIMSLSLSLSGSPFTQGSKTFPKLDFDKIWKKNHRK